MEKRNRGFIRRLLGAVLCGAVLAAGMPAAAYAGELRLTERSAEAEAGEEPVSCTAATLSEAIDQETAAEGAVVPGAEGDVSSEAAEPEAASGAVVPGAEGDVSSESAAPEAGEEAAEPEAAAEESGRQGIAPCLSTDEEEENIENCLTFTADGVDSSITFKYKSGTSMEYSTSGGRYWRDCRTAGNETGTVISLRAGKSVMFRGKNIQTDDSFHFSMTGRIIASGDVTSLFNAEGGDVRLRRACFQSMFLDCSSLITAPELPSTVLANSCYYKMFSGCTGLTEAPELPAENLYNSCYEQMFSGCTGLTEAPALSAKTMKNSCYEQMFSGCSSLVTAPELPAETLENSCYSGMFRGCSSLREVSALPAETLENFCYSEMFYDCTSLETAPRIGALTMGNSSCSSMFWNCKSLAAVSDLKAETLGPSCCEYMFYGCKKLQEAPALPAKTLENYCYRGMFWKCTKLKTAPALPAETMTISCYANMFAGCTSLEKAPSLPAETLAYACYNGMFSICKSLTEVPQLPAKKLAGYCYSSMFSSCSSLILTTAEKETAWTLSVEETAEHWGDSMFYNCPKVTIGETGGYTPAIGVTYYTGAELKPEYTVTFDMQGHGEQVPAQTVEEGGKVLKPADPAEDGFLFTGWYQEAACRNPWVFEEKTVTGDQVLYAMWVRQSGSREPEKDQEKEEEEDREKEQEDEQEEEQEKGQVKARKQESAGSQSLIFMGSASGPVSRGGWISSGGNWKYLLDGSELRNAFAWIAYTGSDQKEHTGSFYFSRSGIMQTGWQKIGEDWYYFSTAPGSEYGRMLVNTRTPDGYTVGADGKWIP